MHLPRLIGVSHLKECIGHHNIGRLRRLIGSYTPPTPLYPNLGIYTPIIYSKKSNFI